MEAQIIVQKTKLYIFAQTFNIISISFLITVKSIYIHLHCIKYGAFDFYRNATQCCLKQHWEYLAFSLRVDKRSRR